MTGPVLSPFPSPGRPAILQNGHLSSLENLQDIGRKELAWAGCSGGGGCSALSAEAAGVTGRSPAPGRWPSSCTRTSRKGPQAPHGDTRACCLGARPSGPPVTAALSGPSCCFQGLRKHRPFLSYLLWPEGLQCCPLELLWAHCWPVTA